MNIPLAISLLERMDQQLEELTKSLREMRETLDAPMKVETPWTEEMEDAYRDRHRD